MDGYDLTGLIELYLSAGDSSMRQEASAAMNRLVEKDGSVAKPMASGNLLSLFYWFDETGEKQYEKAIFHQAKHLQLSVETMPFYTAWDTRYGKKEYYSSIAKALETMTDWQGTWAVALADTIGWMSPEIFEYYKALADLLKVAVRSAMKWEREAMNREELQKWGYAALKGCNSGVLQNEAYQEFGMEIWKSTAGARKDLGGGMERRLRAQYLLLGK